MAALVAVFAVMSLASCASDGEKERNSVERNTRLLNSEFDDWKLRMEAARVVLYQTLPKVSLDADHELIVLVQVKHKQLTELSGKPWAWEAFVVRQNGEASFISTTEETHVAACNERYPWQATPYNRALILDVKALNATKVTVARAYAYRINCDMLSEVGA